MRQSTLAAKIRREAPKDEESLNAIWLIRAGFIDKLAAGIYSFLPLGLKTLRKIENIIREEMIAIGGQEILMPALHPKENWEKTGRWSTLDVLFKLSGVGDKDYALGSTHEEIVSPLVKKIVFSYKDLPLYLFQIQTKFRNEPRAKSGLLRTREFSMKDLYSFHADAADLDKYYEKAIAAYKNIFKKCGLGEKTYLTLASGGSFSKYSHEFQTASETGEDTIYICQKCQLAINKEIKDENPVCPECQNKDFKETFAVEVGNIFKLGTKYSAPFDLKYKDEKGQEQTVIMGCYGLGPTRLMGAVVETYHDDKGLIWPEEVAPFKIHLLALGDDDKIKKEADKLYEKLLAEGLEVLYDERAISPGEKFAEADLIGLPWRLVISEKTLEKKSVELKKRDAKEVELIDLDKAAKKLK
ncbi:MAG: His/Gly/Thr/Pro-type tRNA ligase C-terminal domain-containing protein [Candidatus Portnoybacteria bacterium]|nr:His/Gly/Thr/Pro-type tRNA ligase C-terminal domain-containing protein [Candidatus Portnoybacteria bacterium]